MLKKHILDGTTLTAFTKPLSDKLVALAVWFLLFGVELSDAQAATAAAWGASGSAGFFVFPRLIQRIAFNVLVGRVKQLRLDTLSIVTSHGLQPLFGKMNDALPEAYRQPDCGRAVRRNDVRRQLRGRGRHAARPRGPSHNSCSARLSTCPRAWSPSRPGDLHTLYQQDPDAFIKECDGLDASHLGDVRVRRADDVRVRHRLLRRRRAASHPGRHVAPVRSLDCEPRPRHLCRAGHLQPFAAPTSTT